MLELLVSAMRRPDLYAWALTMTSGAVAFCCCSLTLVIVIKPAYWAQQRTLSKPGVTLQL